MPPLLLGDLLQARDARANQELVSDQPEGEADQDRREGRQPRPYIGFQMAEVAVARTLFAEILRLIAELRPPPNPAGVTRVRTS
jgi:hypothetical protein